MNVFDKIKNFFVKKTSIESDIDTDSCEFTVEDFEKILSNWKIDKYCMYSTGRVYCLWHKHGIECLADYDSFRPFVKVLSKVEKKNLWEVVLKKREEMLKEVAYEKSREDKIFREKIAGYRDDIKKSIK